MPRTPNQVLDAGPATLPPWVDELVAPVRAHAQEQRVRGVDLWVRCGHRFALAGAVVEDAADLGDEDFGAAVEAAYDRIGEALAGLDARHPVRFWNYLPRIHRTGSDGLDRYMVFNAARQAAFRRWYGGSPPGRNLPTASALDAGRSDLVVHALAAPKPGRSFENPRQIPAYRYSSRYGPEPPCFARSTAVPFEDAGAHRLLIGGTASIVGEESRHPKDLQAQLEETGNNLLSLINAVQTEQTSAGGGEEHDHTAPERAVSELRAYVVRSEDRDAVIEDLTRRFPGIRRLEVMQANLCRRPLLVEVEGLALCDVQLPDTQPPFEDTLGLPRNSAGRS